MFAQTKYFAFLGLVLAFAGNASAQQTSSASSKSDAVLAQKFEKWINDFVMNPHDDIALPSDWFDQQFDSATAAKLKSEYAPFANSIGQLGKLMSAKRNAGLTEIRVSVHQKAIDRKATGLQNAVLQRMKNPVPLYSMRMIKPGDENGFSLLSFVEVGGKFRFAGKMQALSPKQGDMVLDILNTTPIESMEKLLQDKGLLKTSAVKFLQAEGVLR